jgi:hypothetical protein
MLPAFRIPVHQVFHAVTLLIPKAVPTPVIVTLTSVTPAVSVPATITIPSGATGAQFDVTALSAGGLEIRASANGFLDASLKGRVE